MDWNLYLRHFYAIIDTMDPERFSHCFAEDGSFRFANHPAAVGRAGIAGVAKGVFDQLSAIGHRVTNTGLNSQHHLFVEGVVTYHRKDDKKIELPFACVFQFVPTTLNGPTPLIQDYRSYVDVAPLFA